MQATTRIGDQLRKARVERHLTIDQAANATRIRARYLQALENGEVDALPSKVQAKGFLRLYANFLEIPVQPLLDTWDGKAPSIVKTPEPEPPIESRSQSAIPDRGSTPEKSKHSPPVSQSEDVSVQEPGQSLQQTTSSQEIFLEIGNQLRQQRELLGIKLSDVENFIHIRQFYLGAMENGRLEDLPSPVQGRGMLSNYAHFLDMDVDALLLRFAEGLQIRRIERKPLPAKSGLFTRRKGGKAGTLRKWITLDLLIGGTLILGLMGLGIWAAAQVSAMRNEQVKETAPSVADIIMVSSTAISFPKDQITRQPTQAQTKPAATGNAPLAAEDITGTLPSLEPGPLQVYIIARQRAWMRVIVDQKVKFEGRVVPGTAYPFSGKTQIELLTGNAAALQVLFNQNDLGTLGLTGQVSALIFTTNGIVTPTISFTSTLTATKPATATLFPTPTQPTATITPLIP